MVAEALRRGEAIWSEGRVAARMFEKRRVTRSMRLRTVENAQTLKKDKIRRELRPGKDCGALQENEKRVWGVRMLARERERVQEAEIQPVGSGGRERMDHVRSLRVPRWLGREGRHRSFEAETFASESESSSLDRQPLSSLA